MQFPVGYDDFGEVIENKLVFVDKTLLVKEFLDDRASKVSVVLRPRRFGKTQLAIVFEFKVREKNEALKQTAQRALAQIEAKQYTAECVQRGIGRVLKIGIGFENKEFALISGKVSIDF